MSKKIKIITASVRPERAGAKVTDWIKGQLEDYRGPLEFSYVDLKEWNLPFMNEPMPPSAGVEYTHELTKKWSREIEEADGFIFITPEYNHGYPPALKNAVDYLYKEWKDKPAAFVGYGGSGATESIRQFSEVLTFLGIKIIDARVSIRKIWEAFEEDGRLKDENVQGTMREIFSQLETITAS
jgi:NAD(P)H-dependent FMN reductase